jgi:hypothetical protein
MKRDEGKREGKKQEYEWKEERETRYGKRAEEVVTKRAHSQSRSDASHLVIQLRPVVGSSHSPVLSRLHFLHDLRVLGPPVQFGFLKNGCFVRNLRACLLYVPIESH